MQINKSYHDKIQQSYSLVNHQTGYLSNTDFLLFTFWDMGVSLSTIFQLYIVAASFNSGGNCCTFFSHIMARTSYISMR